MRTTKNTWRNVAYICVLLAAIFLLFQWYSATNSHQIEQRNLTYAMDSARQTAKRINGELTNAQRRVHNYAYLLGTTASEPDISMKMLQELEHNSDFDAFRFTNAKGINLASDGSTNDSRDREYFLEGMKGESGSTMVMQSRITKEPMMVFYAPLDYKGKTFGVLLGLYHTENYLREMLETSYFGEAATVFLCSRDGQVVASSEGKDYEQPLPDMMRDDGVIDAGTAEKVWSVFRGETDEEGFICDLSSLTDNLCAMHVPGTDYILVQTFPQSVTRAMIKDANHTGMVLQVILACLFAVYVLVLLFRGRVQRKKLEKQNTQFGYVLDGLNTLFSSRYLTVDLEADTYSYMAGMRPLSSSLAMEGPYEDIIRIHAQDLIGEEEQQRFRQTFEADSLTKILSEQDIFTYECHVSRSGKEEWEHLITVCLQIENGHDGILCDLDPQAIAESIIELLEDKEKRKALGGAAAKKDMTQAQELRMLLELL